MVRDLLDVAEPAPVIEEQPEALHLGARGLRGPDAPPVPQLRGIDVGAEAKVPHVPLVSRLALVDRLQSSFSRGLPRCVLGTHKSSRGRRASRMFAVASTSVLASAVDFTATEDGGWDISPAPQNKTGVTPCQRKHE